MKSFIFREERISSEWKLWLSHNGQVWPLLLTVSQIPSLPAAEPKFCFFTFFIACHQWTFGILSRWADRFAGVKFPLFLLWFSLIASYQLFSPGTTPTAQDKNEIRKNSHAKSKSPHALWREMDTQDRGKPVPDAWRARPASRQGCLRQTTVEPHQRPCGWYWPTVTQSSLCPDPWRQTDNLPCPGSHSWGNGSALVF